MPKEHYYYVYFVSNHRRTVFYVGLTNHLLRRTIEHKYELGSEFTRRYKLKVLVYFEEYQYAQEAIEREKQIKRWNRQKKLNLVKRKNPHLKDLSQEIFDGYDIIPEDIEEIIRELKNKYHNYE